MTTTIPACTSTAFLSGAIVPGSIFKLVTLAAAIDNKDDIYDWTYECTGELQLGDDVITCPNAHGTVDIARALSVSCNCALGNSHWKWAAKS